MRLPSASCLSAIIGAAIGLAVGLSRFAHQSFMPIILLLYGLPQITILPIFVLVFGIGVASKIAFGVSHGMFPIMIAVAAGVQKIEPVYFNSARSMGASRWHLLRYVIFPHLVPSFFTGLRLGMSGVLLGVLLAELYVSTAGIGYYHQHLHPELRCNQADRPRFGAGGDRDRPQRVCSPYRAALRAVAGLSGISGKTK